MMLFIFGTTVTLVPSIGSAWGVFPASRWTGTSSTPHGALPPTFCSACRSPFDTSAKLGKYCHMAHFRVFNGGQIRLSTNFMGAQIFRLGDCSGIVDLTKPWLAFSSAYLTSVSTYQR